MRDWQAAREPAGGRPAGPARTRALGPSKKIACQPLRLPAPTCAYLPPVCAQLGTLVARRHQREPAPSKWHL